VGLFLEVLDRIPLDLDAVDLLRNLKVQMLGEEWPALLEKAQLLIEPKAVYSTTRVIDLENDQIYLENGHMLRSIILGDILERGQEIVPYVVTIGSKLETEASKRGLLQSFLLDKIGNYALHKACDYVKSRIEERFGGMVSEFSPGTGTGDLFGIEQQEALFRILDPAGSIGVHLTTSLIMVPQKSESGVFAATREEYVACEYCRRRCESRRAPFKRDYYRIKHSERKQGGVIRPERNPIVD
jgi:hypothetical protein